jgi:hypothetical protein
MKKLVVFIALLISFFAQSQTVVTGKWKYHWLGSDSVFFIPGDTLSSAPLNSIAVKSGIMYVHGASWVSIGGGGGPFYDSTLMASRYKVKSDSIILAAAINTKQPSISFPFSIKRYYNGYGQFPSLNSDSLTEGSTNLFYTVGRSRAAISIMNSGSSGAATYDNSTGVLNIPIYAGGGGLSPIANNTFLGNVSGSTSTPIPLVMNQYDITHYGLVGDSSTDNITAWRALYAILPYGADVYIPPGDFIFSDTIQIRKSIHLHGVGYGGYPFYLSPQYPMKGASNFYFTSGTKNFITIGKSGTNNNPVVKIDGLTIKNTSSSTPTSGSAIKFVDNVSRCMVTEDLIFGFYTNIWIESGSFNYILNNRIIAPIQNGIIQDNIVSFDVGANWIMGNEITSGLITPTTAVGIIIHGGGGCFIGHNWFNAMGVFQTPKQFEYDIYSDFSSGATSDFKIFDNFHENFKRSASYLTNVSGTPIQQIQIHDEEIAPYGDSARNGIYISGFSIVDIHNIMGYNQSSSAYSFIKIDTCANVNYGIITQTGWTGGDDSLTRPGININKTITTPIKNGNSLVYAATSGASLSTSNVSTNGGYAIMRFRPTTINKTMNFEMCPNGTPGTSPSEFDIFESDVNSGYNSAYLQFLMDGTYVNINSTYLGTGTLRPMRFNTGGRTNQLLLSTDGNVSAGNIFVTGQAAVFTGYGANGGIHSYANVNEIGGFVAYNPSSGSGAYAGITFRNNVSNLAGGCFQNGNSNTAWDGANSLNLINFLSGSVTIGTNSIVRWKADASGNQTFILGSDATGDIWYRNSSGYFTRLPIGTSSQTLHVISGLPAWRDTTAIPVIPVLTSSTYTPTLTNISNVASSTAQNCHWTRNGNEITVTGVLLGTATLTATATVIDISLPVSSGMSATTDLSGVMTSSAIAGLSGGIEGNVSSAIARLTYTSVGTGSDKLFFTFTYTYSAP